MATFADASLVPTVWDLALAYVTDCSFPPAIGYPLIEAIVAEDIPTLARATKLLPEYRSDPATWLKLRQVEAFFKKNASFTDDIAAQRNAVASFFQSEKQCRITNRRLQYFLVDNPERLDYRFPGYTEYVSTARKALRHLLGDCEEFTRTIGTRLRVTDGATATSPRARSLPFLKVTRKLRVPERAIPLVGDVLRQLGFDESVVPTKYRTTDFNRVLFVTKNFLTKRVIAGEPAHVMPIQLAFDAWTKDRLKTVWGIDLRSQARSQQLAKKGSIDGSWATIDLERASDTVSLLAVVLLFPLRWVEFLLDTRSPEWQMPSTGACGRYAKYASMGNGTTFTVETAIFGALCAAVGSRDHMVYGDDICIRQEYVGEVIKLLNFFGFTVNREKSFYSRPDDTFFPFRESCGADWFAGQWVTPFYVRRIPTSHTEFHHLINGLVKVSVPEGRVWHLCATLTASMASHVVPLNTDSTLGVFVDPSTAYDLKLIRTAHRSTSDKNHPGPWIPFFWGMASTADSDAVPRYNRGLRPYLLWFLEKEPFPVIEALRNPHMALQYLQYRAFGSHRDDHKAIKSSPWALDGRVTSLVEPVPQVTRAMRTLYVPPPNVPVYMYYWSTFLLDSMPPGCQVGRRIFRA